MTRASSTVSRYLEGHASLWEVEDALPPCARQRSTDATRARAHRGGPEDGFRHLPPDAEVGLEGLPHDVPAPVANSALRVHAEPLERLPRRRPSR